MTPRPSELGANKAETNPIKRYRAKPTRKNTINAMCAYCMGGKAARDWGEAPVVLVLDEHLSEEISQ